MPSFISESFHLSSSISILTGVILPLFSILIYNVTGVIYEKAISNVLRLSALLLARFMTASAPLSILLSAVIVGSMHGISLLMTCMVPPVFACHGKVSFISGLLNASTYAGSALSSCGIAFFCRTVRMEQHRISVELYRPGRCSALFLHHPEVGGLHRRQHGRLTVPLTKRRESAQQRGFPSACRKSFSPR